MKVKVGKFLSCPFCGGKPKVIELNKGFAGFTGNIYDYLVKCGACRASTATFHSIEDALKAWNRRACPEVEVAEKCIEDAVKNTKELLKQEKQGIFFYYPPYYTERCLLSLYDAVVQANKKYNAVLDAIRRGFESGLEKVKKGAEDDGRGKSGANTSDRAGDDGGTEA